MSKGKSSKNSSLPPAEAARRKQQSQRDKAAAMAGSGGKRNTAQPQRQKRPPQNTSDLARRFPVQKGDSGGMLFCRQMALPGEQKPPIRLPTQSMEKTAVASFIYNSRVPFTGNYTYTPTNYDGAALQDGSMSVGVSLVDYMMVVYGQPGLQYIHGPFLNEEGVYETHFNNGMNSYTFQNGNAGQGQIDINTFLPIAGLRCVSGTPYFGLRMCPAGHAAGNKYVFLTAGLKLAIAYGTSAPYAFSLKIHEYQDFGQVVNITQIDVPGNAPADTVIWTVPLNGFYAIELAQFLTQGGANITLAFKFVKENSTVHVSWHMAMLNDLNPTDNPSADPQIGEHMRRTGAAVLITNVSNAFNKQGEVIAARLPNGRFSEYTLAAAGSASEMYTGLAAKGCYTYMDFTVADEEFRDYTNRDLTGAWNSTFFLDQSELVHVITFQGLYAATTLLARMHMSTEWRNTTQRYSIAPPMGSNFDLLEARRINNSTDYFYENPIHIEDVMRWIRKGWDLTRRYAIPVSRGVAAAFPETAPVALPLGRMLAY